jgi:hypothetical protein
MMKLTHIAALAILVVSGCTKEEALPSEPEIELLSITPLELVQFEDNISLRIKYRDGNGDLGDENPDADVLRVKDSRLSEPDWYHVQPLAPVGSDVAIEGELDITLNTLFLLGNGSQESTTFSIRIRDRAGNFSNEIVTPVILIKDSL